MPEDGRKWAVENRNTQTGATVRYMETYQHWVAKRMAEQANARFAAEGRPYESIVVKA